MYSFDADHLERVAPSGRDPAFVSGDTIVFAEGRKDLVSVDLRTKVLRQVLPAPSPDTFSMPAFSRDRRWLYFIRARRESDIWMATLK